MTKEEKDKLDSYFNEHTATERRFLNEEGIPPNEHGAFAFTSTDGNVHIALDLFLRSYRDWLIENMVHREG